MGAEAAASPCRAAGVVVICVIACDKREAFAQGATGSRACAPDDRLSEAIHYAVPEMDCFRLRSSSYGGQVVAALPCANAPRLSQAMMNELSSPVTPAVAAAAEIGHAHQLRGHAHQLAAASAAEHAHDVAAAEPA